MLLQGEVSLQHASSEQQRSQSSQSSPNEEEQDKLQFAAGTGRTLQPGAIPGRQDSRRSSHQRSLNSHSQVPQRKIQQLSRPRFFKASVKQWLRCHPISCSMHQVHSQVMVTFRGSAATLRVGSVLKPFASATLFCKAGSAAQVRGSICALCPALIQRLKPRRSCRDELTPCSLAG